MRRLATLVLALSGWAAFCAVELHAPLAVRVVVVFAFLCTCPGLALLRFVTPTDSLSHVTFAIALSVALDAIVSEAFAIGHAFQARDLLVVLAGATTFCALVTAGRDLGFRLRVVDGLIRIGRDSNSARSWKLGRKDVDALIRLVEGGAQSQDIAGGSGSIKVVRRPKVEPNRGGFGAEGRIGSNGSGEHSDD